MGTKAHIKTKPKKTSGTVWLDKLGKYTPWILFIFAVLLYINTINYGYVLDDGLVIKENKFTQKGFSGIGDILTHDFFGGLGSGNDNAIYQGGRYRPLSQVTFAIEYAIFRMKPSVGHLVNILMYGLLAMLVYSLLQELFKNHVKRHWYLSIPFIATAIFIAHPIHTEVVANIKSRDEIMGMIGGILTLIFSIKYLEKKKIFHLGLSFFFFLLALLSKESTITFLAVVPMTVYVFRKATIKEHAFIMAPLMVATIIYFVIRIAVIGHASGGHAVVAVLFHEPFKYTGFADRYATVAFTWLKYLYLLIFPYSLTHDYYVWQIPIIGWGDIRAILPAIIYISLVVFALITIWKRNVVAYGILVFLFTFSVTSNFFFDLGLFMNERFMFTPLLGFALVAAYFLNRIKPQKLLTSALLLLLTLYSVKTISRNTAWKDDFTLFTTDVKTSTNSGRCNVIAGSQILTKARGEQDTVKQKEQYEQAEVYLRRGVHIYADNTAGWGCLGEVQIYLNKYDSAVTSLKNVFTYDSVNITSLKNLLYIGTKYDEKNQFSKALSVYKFLDKQNPSNPTYRFNMAYDYKNLGKTDSAFIILENIINTTPDYYDAYNRIAEYYAEFKKDFDKSLGYLKRAYDKNPTYSKTLENLGVVYGMKADFKESLLYFSKAYHLDSTNAKLCGNMAKTYELIGNKQKANEFYAKAARYAQKKQ